MTGCKQKIKEWYRALRQRLTAHAERARFRRFLRSGGARKAYIMGAPQYANLGDSAITLAQRCFLRQSGIPDAAIKEITKEEYEKFRGVIRRCVRPGDLIFYGSKSPDGSVRSVTHVSMYIGDGRIIHSSQLVRINSIVPGGEDYYGRTDVVGVRRILR